MNIRINKWSDRCISVERFATTELLFRFLQIAIANVFTDGVAENEIVRGINAHIFCVRADDDGKLDFEISLMFGERDLDLSLVCKQRSGSLKPNQRRPE